MVCGVRTPPRSRIDPMALIENEAAIQASVVELISTLLGNQLDVKRGELILRALNIAVRNAHRVRFDVDEREMVREARVETEHAARENSRMKR